MHNIIYRSPFNHSIRLINVSAEQKSIDVKHLKELIYLKEAIDQDQAINFNIIVNGKILTEQLNFDGHDISIQLSFFLLGGKGGFGSMLRAIGAQIEKTTNREACRDLSGRRLRDVNEEKRIKEWIKKKSQKKGENRKKEKLKRLAEGATTSNCNFDDTEFEKFRSEIPDIVEESISCGLKQQKRKIAKQTDSSSNNEDKFEPPKKAMKKQNLWLGIDCGSEEDSDDDSHIENKVKK